MEQKKRSGRPRKAEADKVHYQRIAVYVEDYENLVEKIAVRKKSNPKYQLTDAFGEMVDKF